MRFHDAIDQYVDDMVAEGRFTSARTVVAYRRTLSLHAEDVSNRSLIGTRGTSGAETFSKHWRAGPTRAPEASTARILSPSTSGSCRRGTERTTRQRQHVLLGGARSRVAG